MADAPTLLPAGTARRWDLARAFLRYGLANRTTYRAVYWAQLVNAVVKVAAIALVWRAFHAVDPGQFPVGGDAMIAYGVVAALGSVVLDWWSGPHHYLARRIRLGTITGDLLRPMSLPRQLFAIHAGETCSALLLLGVPVYLGALALLGREAAPAGPAAGLLALLSFALSFALLFCCSFLVGMIVLKTLNLLGVMHVYHGVITLLSGFWIPLWFYPEPLRRIAELLPFQSIFFTPLTIYIGHRRGADAAVAILQQAVWLCILLVAVHLAWRFMRRRLVVQGG
ncbi:ABC transporter permease [Glycomyces artemisiae]|uniref:ABC-type uncharacterized transport system permease subunit n=1 Tax=Glycomyces artemisiae TaxID=1076443 RepID=A0A2T0UL22_9ACTN|nr:ABC-2 family transporter protein [Glycomyces artemisiae]PRY58631.1 ABC-type uncharacterized transport system permease subunit [Glycomyces artemisiae]